MSEKKLFILLVVGVSVLISGSVVSDLFNRDLISFRYADEYYFITDALWKVILPVGLLYFCRSLNYRLLSAFFMWLSFESSANLCDELFSAHPEISSPWEYAWALVGVILAFFEYNSLYVLEYVFNLFFRGLTIAGGYIKTFIHTVKNGKRNHESD